MGENISENKIKRALVLSGGGAKGAYAFGCLKAFKERDVHFGAVSGTSVGALNAILWSTDSMSEGQKLWDELSFSTVYPVRILDSNRYPAFLIKFFAYTIVLYNLSQSTWKGIPNPASYFISWIATPLLLLPIFIVILPTTGYIIHFIYSGLDFNHEFGRSVFNSFILSLSLLLPVAAAIVLWDYFFDDFVHSRHDASGFHAFFGLLLLGGSGLLLILNLFGNNFIWLFFACFCGFASFTSFLLSLIFSLLSTANSKLGTVLDSTPLYKTVENILSAKSLTIPTIVVTAGLQSVYDPDCGSWIGFYNIRGLPKHRYSPPYDYFELAPEKKWIPTYQEISHLPSSESALYCAASAALPFGIVPSIQIQGKDFVDGGVADNVPFYPFVEEKPVEEIYVILLEEFKTDEEARIISDISLNAWSERERLQRIRQNAKPERIQNWDRKEYFSRKDKFVSLKEIEQLPVITIFHPRNKSLGNFITGTLNFNGVYASKIMERGYLETLQKLDEMNGEH